MNFSSFGEEVEWDGDGFKKMENLKTLIIKSDCFSKDNSTKYYVGIWYKRVPNDKIVWVANRDSPVQTSSAVLIIQPDGNFMIIDGQTTYRVNKASNNFNTYATLLDSGNLVLLNTSNRAIFS